MKPVAKNFTTTVLDRGILRFNGIKVQQEINDNPRQVRDFHFCRSTPKVRNNPQLAGLSHRILNQMGYHQQQVLADEATPYFLSGSKIMQGSLPIAHNYCGIQFGVWAGQLGDGRAHTLGTINHENKIFELQLKGSGMTPFSRHADGNSVVSSAVREFLASELMHGLNIATTRALSLVITEEKVARDPFYNGVIKMEKAAIVCRVCQSFLRFGSFQTVEKMKDLEVQAEKRKYLSAMAEYLIQNFYPQISEDQCDIYEELFRRVVIASAQMVAGWQSIGFVHGVLNTDNLSMVGATIDYGPFGFIDYFSKDYVSNATDQHERYSYRRQPFIVKWNLERLAEAMDCLVPQSILKDHIEDIFDKVFSSTYDKKMSDKLGLENNQQSKCIVEELLEIMHVCNSNFTNVFRKISCSHPEDLLQNLLIESLPTQYYLKTLTVLKETNFSQQRIATILSHDTGFNPYFLKEQLSRKELMEKLMHEDCEARTMREKALWEKWIQKYLEAKPNPDIRRDNTIQYVLINEVAKNITDQLNTLDPVKQRALLNNVLDVFSNPNQKNEWFETKFWSKRAIPIRLTCSS